MNFRPLQNNVLILRDKGPEVSRGGLFIPDDAREKQTTGKVIAAGPGKVLDNGRLVEPNVKTGDTVIFGQYAGQEIELEKKKYLIISEDELQGVVEEE